MDIVGIIAAISGTIAAIAGIVSCRNSKRYSKRGILDLIERKKEEYSQLNMKRIERYGLNDSGKGRPLDKGDLRMMKLEEEIAELEMEL